MSQPERIQALVARATNSTPAPKIASILPTRPGKISGSKGPLHSGRMFASKNALCNRAPNKTTGSAAGWPRSSSNLAASRKIHVSYFSNHPRRTACIASDNSIYVNRVRAAVLPTLILPHPTRAMPARPVQELPVQR